MRRRGAMRRCALSDGGRCVPGILFSDVAPWPLPLCPAPYGRIPYLPSTSLTRSNGSACTVCPFAVVVVAMNSEL